MNTLGNNINRRLKELDMKQNALAEKAGVSHVLISRLISGKVQSSSKIADIARALNTTVDALLGRVEANYSNTGLSPVVDWDSSTPLASDEVELPLFREVQLSAGAGSSFIQENHGAKLRFAKSTLSRAGVVPANAACCYINGDSMQPILPNGATVAVDTDQKAIIDGALYAVDHGGLLRVKQLYRLPHGAIKIRSFNRDEYPDEVITPENEDDFRIIGKVFWYGVLL